MARRNLRKSEEMERKLDYIKLDLDNIPEILKYSKKTEFKVSRVYNESKYKRYEILDIEDIKIYLTTSNRNDNLSEKVKNAKSIEEYLDCYTEENIVEHTKFLKMLDKLEVNNIKKIEKEQTELTKKIPFEVKYSENYLWQVYYFENLDEYVMLVSVEELENSPFFYILKEQISSKTNKQVYVPIRNVDYSAELLSKRNFEELENYFWLFTKEWPSIYEMFDNEGSPSIHIVGETSIYEDIRSKYKIKIESKEDAVKLYRLAKALYIIQTELPNYFNFKTKINSEGGIDFYFDGRIVEYRVLAKWINREYILCKKKIKEARKVIKSSMKRLSELEEIATEQECEYLAKEKQISTFLECRKTFIGKVKYYFKYSKKPKEQKNEIESFDENEEEYTIDASKIELNVKKKSADKKGKDDKKVELHTIDELILIYKELAEYEKNLKNIVMDINALKLKNKNTLKKIENASLFISEIDNHKKSIFEFWKYSNKDEVTALAEGEIEEVPTVKVNRRTFSFEDDFEKFGMDMDKIQRKVLTNRELDNMYIATTDLLEIVNELKIGSIELKDLDNTLKLLKREMNKQSGTIDQEFDIFGGSVQEKVRIAKLGSKKHREIPKNACNILDITKNTNALGLKLAIEQVVEDIGKALSKIKLQQDISVYKLITESELENDFFEVFNVNQEVEVIENIKNKPDVSAFYLFKLNIEKGTSIVSFTNSIFYDNQNKTLPFGQDVSKKMLVDLEMLELDFVEEDEMKILSITDSDVEIKDIIVYEYNVAEKNK